MTALTLSDLQAALRERRSATAAAASLGLAPPAFHGLWTRRTRAAGIEETPAAYLSRLGLRPAPRGNSPLVSFRLVEYPELEAAAREQEIEPAELARRIVREWLARRP